MDQEHEFFQNQGQRKPAGSKEEVGQVTAVSVPGIGLFPACTRKESRHVPYLGLGLEFNLVSGRWQLGRKKPSGYLL